MRTSIIALGAFLALSIAAVAAEYAIPNRLARAKPGEWMLMRTMAGEHAGEMIRFTVKSIAGEGDDAVVVITDERLDADGAVMESKDVEVPLARHAARLRELEDDAKQVSRERLAVGDDVYTVFSIVWTDQEHDRDMKIWMSDDVPVVGLVKSWSSDASFPAAELVDYGPR